MVPNTALELAAAAGVVSAASVNHCRVRFFIPNGPWTGGLVLSATDVVTVCMSATGRNPNSSLTVALLATAGKVEYS